MTAATGILAIAACMMLPGLLLLQALRPRFHVLGSVAFSVGLSATINHVMVVTLVLLGLYQRPVFIAISLCELCLFFLLNRRAEEIALPVPLEFDWKRIAAIASSAVVLAYVVWTYGRIAFADFGEIFTTWDTVVSWNRWAVEWAAGSLPVQTWEYPQLLPTLWSMIYLMVGTTELQVFPKAMMAWLPIVMFLGFADMAFSGRAVAGTVGAFFALKLLLLFNTFALSGYAELPSGVMAFLAFYAASLTSRHSGEEADRLALLGAAIAAGAALTKQSGVFFALCYPLFLWLVSPAGRRIWHSVALLVLLIAPWYAYRAYAIRFGGDLSNILVVTQFIHAGRTYPQRIAFGLDLIGSSLNGALLYWVIGLLFTALWSRLGRILTLILVLPYLAIYGLFFSYDIRNVLPVLPFVAWAIGVGAANVVELVPTGWLVPMLPSWRLTAGSYPTQGLGGRWAWALGLIFVVVLGVSAFAWAGRWPDRDMLLADQNRRLTLIGDATVNRAVFDFINSEHPSGKILTNNGLLEFIPAVKPYYRGFAFGPWTTSEALATMIKNEPISAILIIGGTTAQLQPAFDRWISEGRMVRRAGAAGIWQFLEVKESEL
jgi:hypothetical protein